MSSRETLDMLIWEEFLLSGASGSVGQTWAPPTICPWMAVPKTDPSTSTIIPESNRESECQHMNNISHIKLLDHKGELAYGKRWQNLVLSAGCWWTWWEPSRAHGSTGKDTQTHRSTTVQNGIEGKKVLGNNQLVLLTVCIVWKRQ